MNTLNDIEQWITDALNKFADDYFKQDNRSSSFCTYSIKEIIGNYGLEKGFRVCASGFPNYFEKEWLYDLVWYKENENRNLISVELVLETEMTYGLPAIKYDFEKLLLSNSNHRIMICCVGRTTIDEIKNYCDRAVDSYAQLKTGDRILTLMWDDFGSGEFIPHLTIKK